MSFHGLYKKNIGMKWVNRFRILRLSQIDFFLEMWMLGYHPKSRVQKTIFQYSQLAITCSKLTTEPLELFVKYVQR